MEAEDNTRPRTAPFCRKGFRSQRPNRVPVGVQYLERLTRGYRVSSRSETSCPRSVVLNLCTPKRLRKDQLPEGYQVAKHGHLVHGVQSYNVYQLTATFQGGQEVSDLELTL